MKSKFININNQNIHYLEKGSGKTLVLLPSLFLTNKSYENIGGILSKKFHVIIPDLYKGKSTFNEALISYDDYCTAFNNFLNKLGLDCVGLIGISYSGLFASYFARKYPNKINSLTLFSTTTVPLKISHPLMLLLIGYIKLLFYNLWSINGIKINTLWIIDGLLYLVKHPKQLFLEPLIAYNFQKIKVDNQF